LLQFSIIILNWNGLDHLKKFLPSVIQTNHDSFEILLADNNSDDDSIEWTKNTYPEVRIVALEKNYGYCAGNNKAAEHATGENLIFLNNDVRVDSDWLTSLQKILVRYPNTAVVQPKIRSHTRPTQFEYAGAAGGYLDRLGYPWCRGRIFETLETDNGQYDAYPSKIFWASGAAFCVRRNLFEMSGGFDEAFEFHMEEIDLCWRFQRMGYDIRVCPDAVIWHLGGGSLKTGSPRKTYFNFRNNLIMLTKNYPASELWLVLFVRFFLDGLAAISFLLSGKFNSWKAVLNAYFDFYMTLPQWLIIRGELQRTHPLKKNLDAFQPVSIVWSYYIRKNKMFSTALSASLVLLSFFSFTMRDRR